MSVTISNLGPTFHDELLDAGFTVNDLKHLTWSPDKSVLHGLEMLGGDRRMFDIVLAAHDPMKGTPTQARLDEIKTDVDIKDMVNRLATNDLAAIRAYINAQVTDLASARQYITRMYCIIAYLIQKGGLGDDFK